MKKLSLRAESYHHHHPDNNNVHESSQLLSDYLSDEACVLDMDYFINTLTGIKAKGVRPDFIGSIIVHYASKWLPDLVDTTTTTTTTLEDAALISSSSSPESCSVTAQWLKKRFFVENLVGILPPEKNSVPCSFLLRLLRTANMVEAESGYRAELERKVARQLDQASLKDLMIPSFTHTCTTLLDVGLLLRLVNRFVALLDDQAAALSGPALVKVAKLVDAYLAEAALDSGLSVDEFMALAGALPTHARPIDDGLYRAIDTYLKAHPNVGKQERTNLCRLMDSRKLSSEASLHASQNERLPVRAVMQVLFTEQTKLMMSRSSYLEWSGSFTAPRSPDPSAAAAAAAAGRSHSKRDQAATAQLHLEIRRLREDVQRLQGHCNAMQAQIDQRTMTTTHDNNNKKKVGFFRWKKFGFIPTNYSSFITKTSGTTTTDNEAAGFGRFTPVNMMKQAKLVKPAKTPPKYWRKSMS